MTEFLAGRRASRAVAAVVLAALCAGLAAQTNPATPTRTVVRNGDYIVAVVNQELVTAVEVDQRLERAREAAQRAGQRGADELALRKQVLDALIDERVVITYARDGGAKVDEAEIDRAVQNIAAQNQLSMEQLRARLKDEGVDYARFRANLRDQILLERVREREVVSRVRISDAEIDRWVDKLRAEAQADSELNIAQILVTVPEGADAAATQARRVRAEQALARVRGGEEFAKVAREISEDGNKERGGEIGLRPVSRLPDLFVDAVRGLKAGDIAATLLKSPAGFHVLRVVEIREGAALRVTQTRPRHILLRTSDQLTPEAAARRLVELKRQIEGGRSFEDIARQFSEDGSAAGGGDLGWQSPGTLVPEFEEAMNRLTPGGALSNPVVSRFGVHLIQVMERREVPLDNRALREQARGALREQKFEETFVEWTKDLRARAYIEMREPPL